METQILATHLIETPSNELKPAKKKQSIKLKLTLPICKQCNEEITTAQFTKIEGSEVFFHIDHLKCFACDLNLTEKIFFEEEEKYFCESCYQRNYIPICFRCSNPIIGEYTSVEGEEFHRKCFTCFECDKPLLAESFRANGKYYCQDCVIRVTDECTKCGEKIIDYKWEAEGEENYHRECFICAICDQQLDGTSFIPHKKNCYHVECFKRNLTLKCTFCQEQIKGQYYRHENKNLHLRCIELSNFKN